MGGLKLERRATGFLRLLPDFLILGAAKSGTTSLYRYLVQHPRIRRARRKEIRFFDREHARGPHWYRAHFPLALRGRWEMLRHGEFATGEASPSYLFYPHAAARVHALVPHAKLIAILRNPIDRAWSQYRHKVRRGIEPLSFEDAIAEEPERTRGEWERILADERYRGAALFHFGYLRRGLYAEQLERWLALYPRESLLVLRAEDLFADPNRVIRDTTDFLGLAPRDPGEFVRGFERHNADEDGRETPRPETRARLASHFAPHNERLYALLGRDFGWKASG
ncbi:MAG TPA: sulfotransferase domain-containing protein [Myxococcota bacterium]|nr:sulfotransferase domain-containing protein [Myxococcota bacterium]